LLTKKVLLKWIAVDHAKKALTFMRTMFVANVF